MVKKQNQIVFISLFISLISLSTLCLASPKIEFKEMAYDAGKIKQGEVVTHIFKFQNTGNEVLSIDKVKAG